MAQDTPDEFSTSCMSFVVPKFLVKQAKSNLEKKHKLDRSVKIQPYRRDAYINACGDHMIIQSTITLPHSMSQLEEKSQALKELGLESYYDRIFVIKTHYHQASDVHQHDAQKNPLREAISKGLQQLPEELLASLCLTIERLLADLSDSYTVYPPMLLLTSKTFAAPTWQTLLTSASPCQLEDLYATVAIALRVTHIAQNAPIPLSTGQSPDSTQRAPEQPPTDQPTTTNILRSPTGLKPLYGDFGPYPSNPSTALPFKQGLEAALWVSTRQNHILQTWAPLHTMFSRGNISEKTRLLTLPSIAAAVAEGEAAGTGSAAVDLYAGIGYFAFCYARAG
ncbi:S-adenosylmethionine-dependent methyltransferase [Coniosporium tulheliwenetii]|uniref:S-adenosylmethionine-dependent methyltransferase n=1 Tax=Coniosporium tulheliwenetii TaxID=3383036 RepID=A0ACC2ZA01_9PEZI|nr:S-adenosylmethionine-dependent methyltransferase [Cladosporium sp. JES 115]